MFALYALLVTLFFVAIDIIYIKTYQRCGYVLKRYLKNIGRFSFSFGRKTPLNLTNRVKRLFFCDFFAKFAVFLLIFGFCSDFWACFALTLCFFLFSPVYALLPFAINLPLENFIKKKYITRARRKFSFCKCKVIAVTGSFGKTSTKNILYQILKEHFSVCVSPKSYNTPMGVCRTILEQLNPEDDFLILEFGARQKGDIDFLAKIVGVDFGMITPISNCHLESFGSLQKIEDTKYELCENCGIVVFNGKSASSKRLYDRFDRNKFLVCEENSFAYAKDVKIDKNGSSFTLVVDGESCTCQSPLLGQSGIDNAVHASAMAYILGVKLSQICDALKRLQATPHRLELIKGGFVDVIDDSYNSNVTGFKEALDVLSCFSARRVVVSPGIVELGKLQYETNREVGMQTAKVADVFLIMNETNKKALTDGAKEFPSCRLLYANTREEQKRILHDLLKVGDVVLFENDLPDNLR